MFSLIKQGVKRIPGVERAVLRYRYHRCLSEIRKQQPIGSGAKILIINHHFAQDIDALIKGCSDRCSFFVLDCMPFFNQALLFFRTDEERDGIIPYPSLPASITRGYRKVAEELFNDLHAIFPFESVVMPSDSFWWIREFLEVVKAKRIPRIVVDKEGIITPYYYEMHSRQIRERYPFISDHLLVWSERQKSYWIKAGAPSECIKVLGQPRSDFFFKPERWRDRASLGLDSTRKVLLFFTFDIDAYIHIFPHEEIQRESLSWLPLRNDINDVLISFAKQHPEIDVVVKVHPQQSDIAHIRQLITKSAPSNIKILDGAEVSNHLIVNSDIVVGFQTTALVEAMLTNKPIVYTGWTDTERKLREQLIPFHNCEGLKVVTCQEDFVSILDDWAAGDNLGGTISARKEFTDYYLNADGKVCERISAALASITNGVK